jgi:hypothetical protein
MASFTTLCYQLDSKRLRPYCPVRPVAPVTFVAGQAVTYRYQGDVYTANVLSVGVGAFDEPEYYLDSKVKILRYAIIGIAEQRLVA